MFEIIVIGNGLIGSAAIKHLSQMADKVAVIGPDEPTNWAAHEGVFASHYDQGRITRVLDNDEIWARLAAESIALYGEIEAQSGIAFHKATGGLRVSANPELSLQASDRVGQALNVAYERTTAEHVNQQRPYFNFPPGSDILWEYGQAGYVNPRSLIAAQTAIAKQSGATIIRETAVELREMAGGIDVTTETGRVVHGRRVLLATGAYTNMLLPEQPLALERKGQVILKAEVDAAERARLADMPTLIYRLSPTSAMDRLYMLPPIAYPDGRTYIKLGGVPHSGPIIFSDWDQILAWFHSAGDPDYGVGLRSVLAETLPDVRFQSMHTVPCILAYTPHNRPFIDQLSDRLYVAVGGCGSAAKSSDAIGRLAALMVCDRPWPAPFSAEDFRAIYELAAI